jgi:hypothetical protein
MSHRLTLRYQPAAPRRVRSAPAYPRCLGAIVVAAGLCMGCKEEPAATAGDVAPAFTDAGARTAAPPTATSSTDSPEVRHGGKSPEPFAPATHSAK